MTYIRDKAIIKDMADELGLGSIKLDINDEGLMIMGDYKEILRLSNYISNDDPINKDSKVSVSLGAEGSINISGNADMVFHLMEKIKEGVTG